MTAGMFDGVFDDSRRVLRITAAIGGIIVLFSTVLPWYSFDVVLPADPRHPHLCGHGYPVGLHHAGADPGARRSPGRAAHRRPCPATGCQRDIALIGLAIFVYGLVRCFCGAQPRVELLPGGVPAVTQLEGGPFIELLGGR